MWREKVDTHNSGDDQIPRRVTKQQPKGVCSPALMIEIGDKAMAEEFE
jgi:hypothetical protein